MTLRSIVQTFGRNRSGHGDLRGEMKTSLAGLKQLRGLAVAQVAPLPIQLILSLLTAAALVPSERGSAVLVVSSGAIGGSVLFGSFHVGAVAALKVGDRRAFRRVTGCVIGLSATSLALATWVEMAQPRGLGLYSADNLLLILLGLALYVPYLFVIRTMQGVGSVASYRTLSLLFSGLYAGGAAITLVPMGIRTSDAVTLPWLVSLLLSLIVALCLFQGTLRSVQLPVRNSLLSPVQSVRASLAAHIGSVSQQIAYRSDLFLLGIFSTAAPIGVYTLAVSLGELVWVVAEIMALSVFADDEIRIGVHWRERVQRRLQAVFLITAGVAGLMFAGAAVLLLKVLPAYATSFPLLLILLPGMVLASGSRVILAAFTARDERTMLLLAAAGTLVLTAIYVPVIAAWGIFGAAAASVVVYVGQYVLLRRLWSRATAGTNAGIRPDKNPVIHANGQS